MKEKTLTRLFREIKYSNNLTGYDYLPITIEEANDVYSQEEYSKIELLKAIDSEIAIQKELSINGSLRAPGAENRVSILTYLKAPLEDDYEKYLANDEWHPFISDWFDNYNDINMWDYNYINSSQLEIALESRLNRTKMLLRRLNDRDAEGFIINVIAFLKRLHENLKSDRKRFLVEEFSKIAQAELNKHLGSIPDDKNELLKKSIDQISEKMNQLEPFFINPPDYHKFIKTLALYSVEGEYQLNHCFKVLGGKMTAFSKVFNPIHKRIGINEKLKPDTDYLNILLTLSCYSGFTTDEVYERISRYK